MHTTRNISRPKAAGYVLGFAGTFSLALLGLAAPALANAPNPQATTAQFTFNANRSVTVDLHGTWIWPGQSCSGRWGEGWAVDWWGITQSQAPAPFSLQDATEVLYSGSPPPPTASTTTGTVASTGSIPFSENGRTYYFHVGTDYAGEDINSGSTCTDYTSGSTSGSEGSWAALATYPSAADVPGALCVNMYDEHGTEGGPIPPAPNFSPTGDPDNSIQNKSFDPSSPADCLATASYMSGGGSTLPAGGAIGAIGTAAAGGGLLVLLQRRRRRGPQVAKS